MSTSLQYLTNEEGKKTAVIVPWKDYIRFMEDMEDLAAVADRREEPRIPHDQFLADLRKDRGEAGIFVQRQMLHGPMGCLFKIGLPDLGQKALNHG